MASGSICLIGWQHWQTESKALASHRCGLQVSKNKAYADRFTSRLTQPGPLRVKRTI